MNARVIQTLLGTGPLPEGFAKCSTLAFRRHEVRLFSDLFYQLMLCYRRLLVGSESTRELPNHSSMIRRIPAPVPRSPELSLPHRDRMFFSIKIIPQ
jgi:hypothetical protein